jgi:excinuclease UvrABC nuclease subunit
MSIHIVDSLGGVWRHGRSNSYSIFAGVENRYGVYIFKSKEGDIYYVGEARDQDLKDRVTQNFRATDSGGTFRNNFLAEENSDFEGFKAFLSDKEILFFTMDSGMLIRALESILILTLRPKYNRDT